MDEVILVHISMQLWSSHLPEEPHRGGEHSRAPLQQTEPLHVKTPLDTIHLLPIILQILIYHCIDRETSLT